MHARRLVGLLAALALAAPTTVRGQVTVGTEQMNTYTCGPFACHVGQTRHQQVYDASYFGSVPLSISSVTFQRFSIDPVPLRIASGTYTLLMSTTSREVGGLSLDFAENITSPQSLFAVVVNPSVIGNAVVHFVGTPFVYDPSAGNLLLDWVFDLTGPIGQEGSGNLSRASTGTSSIATRDAITNLPSPFATSGALTTFNAATSTVPEPSTWALLASGLTAIGVIGARRRRSRS